MYKGDTMSKVLASVEGLNIHENDLNELIQHLPPEQQTPFKTEKGRRELLNELVAQNLFYLQGLEDKIEEKEDFKLMLEDAKVKLLKSFVIADFMRNVTIDDQEVKDFYDQHPEQMMSAPHIRASHILVPAEQQAIDIIEEIKSGEKTFEEAAKSYSTCPSKEKGGDLSYFHKGRMVPAFEEAAFAMDVGQVSDAPVKSEFGYHIIKVTDTKDPELLPFEIVHDNLKRYLLGEKQNDEFTKRIDELKEKYTVTINE